jgi:hypothetical protein
MTDTAPSAFVSKAAAKSRITFGDVRRLQLDILPGGVTSRDDAELLISLDRSVGKVDRSWADYLVETIMEFVVWVEEPTGSIDDDTVLWLAEALSSGGALTKNGRLIAREVARERETEVEEDVPTSKAAAPLNPASLPPSAEAGATRGAVRHSHNDDSAWVHGGN